MVDGPALSRSAAVGSMATIVFSGDLVKAAGSSADGGGTLSLGFDSISHR